MEVVSMGDTCTGFLIGGTISSPFLFQSVKSIKSDIHFLHIFEYELKIKNLQSKQRLKHSKTTTIQ